MSFIKINMYLHWSHMTLQIFLGSYAYFIVGLVKIQISAQTNHLIKSNRPLNDWKIQDLYLTLTECRFTSTYLINTTTLRLNEPYLRQAVMLHTVIALRAVVVTPSTVRQVRVETGIIELHPWRVKPSAWSTTAEHSTTHPHACCKEKSNIRRVKKPKSCWWSVRRHHIPIFMSLCHNQSFYSPIAYTTPPVIF